MNAEFIEALNAIEKERGISKDILIDAFESALIAAYKRNYGAVGNVRATVDRDTGEVQIFASKTVVEEVENPYCELTLEQAKKVNVLYEVGDVLEEEVDPRKFGRIAAQTAKQVVVQRIREAERGVIFDEFVEKENEVLTAIVQVLGNIIILRSISARLVAEIEAVHPHPRVAEDAVELKPDMPSVILCGDIESLAVPAHTCLRILESYSLVAMAVACLSGIREIHDPIMRKVYGSPVRSIEFRGIRAFIVD